MTSDWLHVYRLDRDHPVSVLCGPRIRPNSGSRKLSAARRRRREAAEVRQIRQSFRVLRVHRIEAAA